MGSRRTWAGNLLIKRRSIIFAYWFVPFNFILLGRKFICFAKFLYIFFHRLLIISSQYYEGPISPCTLVSVSLTASGHPACDLYDAIYLKGLFDLISWTVPPGFLLIFTCHSCIAPSTTKELPEGYVEWVKHVHDSGGYGSRGYGIFVIYLSSYLFFISINQLFQEAFKCTFLFIYFLSALVGVNMIGAKRKQTKTFCEITKQLCRPGCFTS